MIFSRYIGPFPAERLALTTKGKEYLTAYFNVKPTLEQVDSLSSLIPLFENLKNSRDEYNTTFDTSSSLAATLDAYNSVFSPTQENYILAKTVVTDSKNMIQELSNTTIPADQAAVYQAKVDLAEAQATDFIALESAVAVATQTYTQLDAAARKTEVVVNRLTEIQQKLIGPLSGGTIAKYLPRARSISDIRSRI